MKLNFEPVEFLFEGFFVTNFLGYCGISLICSFAAVLYELLRFYHLNFSKEIKYSNSMYSHVITSHSDNSDSEVRPYTTKRFWQFAIHGGIYSIQIGIGYFLMLSIMIYNIYIFLCVIIGSAVGYFIFSPLVLYESDFILDTNILSTQTVSADIFEIK